MPSRRDLIRMTDEELWAFMDERKSLQVATINKDGSPHLTTLWFAVIDGAIVFETFKKSQKIVNLERDPRITVLVEDGETYDQLRGVSMSGVATLDSDPEAVKEPAYQVMKKMNPDVAEDALRAMAVQMSQKRTAVSLRPQKIVSWDHRKLAGRY